MYIGTHTHTHIYIYICIYIYIQVGIKGTPDGEHHCVAVCCNVVQCVAVCCSVLQCVAVCCSVLHQRHTIWRARHSKRHCAGSSVANVLVSPLQVDRHTDIYVDTITFATDIYVDACHLWHASAYISVANVLVLTFFLLIWECLLIVNMNLRMPKAYR